MIDLPLRRKLITATDVGPIFGVDPWRTGFDVWADKQGNAPPFEPTARMLLGQDLEQGIVQAYSRITRRQVQWANVTVQHPVRRWMGASPDALVGDPVERVVDAKLVFYDQRRKWGSRADQIPEAYQLQMWWQMAVLECDVADVAAWMGEDEPRIYEIERNLEVERVIIARCEEWHRRYVEGNEVPPISGSKAADRWLQQAFPHHERPDMREATEEEIAFLEEYALVRRDQEEFTERRKEMENAIKLAIADREGLEWPGGKFTWRRTKDVKQIDWEELGTYMLNTRIKAEEEREALRVEYTRTKPGMRKIRFTCDALDVSDDAAA